MNLIKKHIINVFLVFFSIIFILIFLELFLLWNDYYRDYKNPYVTKINNIKYEIYFDKKKLNKKKKFMLLVTALFKGTFVHLIKEHFLMKCKKSMKLLT